MVDDKKAPAPAPQQAPKPVNVVPAFPTEQKSNKDFTTRVVEKKSDR